MLAGLKEAHEALSAANEDLKNNLLSSPPRSELEADQFAAVFRINKLWNDTFVVCDREVALYNDPATREQSQIRNIKELLLVNAACREAVALWSNLVQRRQELDVAMSHDDMLTKIAARVPF